MKRSWHGWRRAAAGIVGSLVVLLATAALATEVVLKDGRILRGRVGETVGLAEQNGAGEADALKQIVFVNDDLRLTFVSRRQVAASARHLAGERGEVRAGSSRETGSAVTVGRRSCRSARRRGP